ncbi:MAG: hypothetical protein P1U89_24420 [Verrucomicrobiales bacterium]|nr:hypothetical protein [Verrucomicrobiales bacterium]
MNTNTTPDLPEYQSKSITRSIWAVSALTVLVPILVIVFDANQTEFDGILVRESGSAADGKKATVTLTEPVRSFRTNIASSGKFDYEIGLQQEVAATGFLFPNLDEYSISDQISELTPAAVTLPAASGAQILNRKAVTEPDSGNDNHFSITEVSGDYQSASDFVESLAPQD